MKIYSIQGHYTEYRINVFNVYLDIREIFRVSVLYIVDEAPEGNVGALQGVAARWLTLLLLLLQI